MQLYDAISEMAARSGTTVNAIENKLGKRSFVANAKSRGSVFQCDNLAMIANVCGYSLALVPTESLPRNAIEIAADQR